MEVSVNCDIALASCNFSGHDIAFLASSRFADEAAFYRDAKQVFSAVYLLQTCNRIEILVHGRKDALEHYLTESGKEGFTFFEQEEVLEHLGKLAAGTQSLIVGEDQILGQLKDALLFCEEQNASDAVIETCIAEAVHLGVRVRQSTTINRGAVSIGSAAVMLAEAELGNLGGKNILVVGGGEMGQLVAKSLAEKQLKAIYVTNRTYENAKKIAEEVGGRAMHLDQLYPCIALSDVVISCTAAPHQIISKKELEEIMDDRLWPLDPEPRKLLIIDIANPPDVDAACSDIPGVTLCTIDSLRKISNETMQHRYHEAEHAEEIVTAYLPEFIKAVNRTAADGILSSLYSWAESIRIRELKKARNRLEHGADTVQTLEDLTTSLTKKLLEDAATAIKKSSETEEPKLADHLVKTITGRRP
ncbi:MAG TPA: glutamyl-tRNA reductase [Methanocorpusculum sp.]|nr:glutamyl-tRNA reductase [Methanocorpusculum sp.]